MAGALKERQLEALTGLLGGGAAKPAGGADGAAGAADPLSGLTGALGGGAAGGAGAGNPLSSLTGALPIKVKERSDGSLDMLAAM